MKDLLSIVSKFKVQGTVGEIKPLGAGLRSRQPGAV